MVGALENVLGDLEVGDTIDGVLKDRLGTFGTPFGGFRTGAGQAQAAERPALPEGIRHRRTTLGSPAKGRVRG